VAIDLFSRSAIDRAMGGRLTADLAMQVTQAASWPAASLGSESSIRRWGLSATAGIVRHCLLNESKGYCRDNAVIEGFFHTLKISFFRRV